MDKLRIATFVALLCCACLGGLARGASLMKPDEFVAKASASGQAEVELGRLALQKSHSGDVRAFAQRMVDDHSRIDATLAALAKSKGLKLAGPGASQRATLAQLGRLSDAQFDEAYAARMVKDHDEAVSLFSAAGTLDDPELAAFARQTLPVLVEHQEIAHHLRDSH
ncbi:MAG TPA: DUF4142 domain-containing protein [Steroidobacteraceae bacterium]|nr:DUF4142 domain-containing protein [Steroidobacteraceae bacterium]